MEMTHQVLSLNTEEGETGREANREFLFMSIRKCQLNLDVEQAGRISIRFMLKHTFKWNDKLVTP